MAVFELSRQLLSRQQHYDWGLRALKTVLRVGGRTLALTLPLTPAPDTAAYDAQVLRVGGQLIHQQKKSGEVSHALEEQVLIKAPYISLDLPTSP